MVISNSAPARGLYGATISLSSEVDRRLTLHLTRVILSLTVASHAIAVPGVGGVKWFTWACLEARTLVESGAADWLRTRLSHAAAKMLDRVIARLQPEFRRFVGYYASRPTTGQSQKGLEERNGIR